MDKFKSKVAAGYFVSLYITDLMQYCGWMFWEEPIQIYATFLHRQKFQKKKREIVRHEINGVRDICSERDVCLFVLPS